jgi:hypothetical protein
LRLSGLGDPHIQEASAAAGQVVGFSAYLQGIHYDVATFQRELDAAVAYLKSQQPR